MDTHSQIDVGRGASTLIQYQEQATLLTRSTPLSAIRPVPTQPHRYYQHNPEPSPAPPSLGFYTHVKILQSRHFHLEHNNRYSLLCDKRSEADAGTPWLFESPILAPPTPLPSFHSHDLCQGHLYSAPYSNQHPETSNYAKMPVEPLYPPQFAHGPSFIWVSSPSCVNHNTPMRLLSPWPYSVRFGRLH